MLNISLEFYQRDFRRLAVNNEAVPTHLHNADGSMLIRLERFGFSSTNLASALSPGLASSWPQAFPIDRDRVRLPVWGYAQVIASNGAELDAGTCFFGCFPTTRYLLIDPNLEPLERFGVGVDRLFNPSSENLPALVDHNAFTEYDLQILLRPLMTAAYMIADELIDSQFWQAAQIVITCGSSKTAMGLSYFLQDYFHRHNISDCPEIIALTAQRHVAFVRQHGHFDRVLSYEDFRRVHMADTVLVDFAGNFQLQRMLLYYLRNRIIHAYALGACHWNEVATGAIASSAEYFSAWEYYDRRQREGDDIDNRFQQAWGGVCAAFQEWLRPQLIVGPERVRWVYEQVLAGTSKPEVGYLCKI